MKPIRRMGTVLTTAGSAAVLTLAVGAPAQAASTGWHTVFTTHYGVATNYSAYQAVAAPGSDDAWAFGTTNEAGLPAPGRPVAESWNGTKWSSSPLPSGLSSSIQAVSFLSPSDGWAVTEVGGDVLHWNGSKWSVAEQIPAAGSDLLATGITAVSDSDVWVFGASGAGPGLGTWHYDGQTWTQETGTVASGLALADAVSATDIWAIGSTSSGPAGDALAHYNGTSWTLVKATALNGLEFADIQALSSTDVWAAAGAAQGGNEQLLHFNGSGWTSVKSPYPSILLAFMAQDGQGGFWFDNGGLATNGTYSGKTWVVHYSASGQWSRAQLASGSMGPLALTPGTTSLWGAGRVATKTPASDARVWEYSPAS
ncbi:MAG: hypothetical protein ACRDNF_22685 [Streptosporangiaceae bacterium]